MTTKNISQITWLYYAFCFLRVGLFAGVLIPFFTQHGGLSLTQVQLLQSWFMLCFFLLEIPTGAVADYFGRKQSLIFGAVLSSIGIAYYGLVPPSFIAFMIGEFVLAAAMALI